DTAVAKAIAKKIRASSGGFPCVKAMGVDLKARQLAQVSMNLTDFETTGIDVVFDAVRREAAAVGVDVVGSEIVGLVPRRALEDATVHYLKVENFKPELILENRLDRVLAEHARPAGEALPLFTSRLAEGVVAAVAAPTPTPGGGSVSALAGALAAALGEMVAGLTLKRKSFAAHHAAVEESRRRLHELGQHLLANVDRDAASYDAVLAAMRLPKATEGEQAARDQAISDASRTAAEVPLETAERVADVETILEALRSTTIPQAASDLTVALELARAARRGAVENVRVNLVSISDATERARLEARTSELEREISAANSTHASAKSS
ncbi:MAG TPA: cyclodeaminase/cyclohydrolase family protein, partial [Terriglobia bacterium]|nr:cyclodeaminase/cyclohydrolase family protein [Terriglobia bacterium]